MAASDERHDEGDRGGHAGQLAERSGCRRSRDIDAEKDEHEQHGAEDGVRAPELPTPGLEVRRQCRERLSPKPPPRELGGRRRCGGRTEEDASGKSEQIPQDVHREHPEQPVAGRMSADRPAG